MNAPVNTPELEAAIKAATGGLLREQRPDGHWDIRLDSRLHRVHPQAKRAHQGWRYLEDADAPADLLDGEVAGDALPGKLVSDLAKLGLV